MNAPRFELHQSFGHRAIDLADRWAVLEQRGYNRKDAAVHIGVTFAALDRAIQRARHYRARPRVRQGTEA